MPRRPSTITVGILGGGQLARMLALAGHPLGIRCRVLDPSPDAPAAGVCEHVIGDFTDTAVLDRFARGLDVVTYEFENVPAGCVSRLGSILGQDARVFPSPAALAVGQDRLLEKNLFRTLGIPVTEFAGVDSIDDLRQAVRDIGTPAILKTRRLGYDGKGQARLASGASDEEIERAWTGLSPPGDRPASLILERLVAFEAEASMLAVRSRRGDTRMYPLVRNDHQSGILRRSRAPWMAFAADLPHVTDPAELEHLAQDAATRILDHFGYVGVLAVEFFVSGGRVIASEIAPRVHNSGHWTIEGSVTSQFENHLRAVCDLPLGETAMRSPSCVAAMHNLVGGWPDPRDHGGVLGIPGCHLHLYGKSPRPGRKVGHATIVGTAAEVGRHLPRLEALAEATWLGASPASPPAPRPG